MKFSGEKTRKWKRILTKDEHGFNQINLRNHLLLTEIICGLIFICGSFSVVWLTGSPQKVAAENTSGEIENAIFTRQEFFGSQAIVPFPTAEAREKLVKLAENSPDNPQILEKLAELDEKLLRFDETENNLKHLAEIDRSKLENLSAFYERHAQFEKQAETLKKILFSTVAEKRAATFERLIDTARKHDLKEYLQTAFYSEIAKENTDVYPIFVRLIDNLTEEKNYPEALNFVRQAKIQFPDRKSALLEKEIEILLETNDAQEAEKIYTAAFDPFWTETQAQKFYDFLNAQDRLRAYGSELKTRFKKNPADFDAGIRLALYQNHDYSYGNDSIAPIILKLEQAKKSWTTEELVTVSRLLIHAGEADLASRFLYTLYVREDFKSNSELRAKILYQLFEMFSDAENRRLPLTKGDLRFYEDVARADTNPGIATGILSLIFSDSGVREKFSEQEIKANKSFNRAAAFRIFEEYKSENPASAELEQMYLDIVRLYTATKDTEIAEKTLNEFADRFENSTDYPGAALKLADAFTTVKNEEKARQVYQKALDYLGKQGKVRAAKKVEDIVFSDDSGEEVSTTKPNCNEGINIPNEEEAPKTDYYYDDEKTTAFHDYLGRKDDAVTYQEVLEKYVASFANEKKTADILALYSNEIAKYPDEEWLYEQRLRWLEQTNLTAEQLEVYKTALARFQTNNWRDRLARFFVRNKRNVEFAEFSEDLVGKLDDSDTREFLSEFARDNVSATEFEKQLYLKLYQSAHARFPHSVWITNGLLRFYKDNGRENEWRALSAEYYFELPEIREQFLNDLARTNRLRDYFEQSKGRENTIYALFRADASARLSDFENGVAAYRWLNELYPNTPEFANRLINFTRSFGQKKRESLGEAAIVANAAADFQPGSADERTRAGEIYAELGDYEKARGQWEKLIETARGDKEIYLDTATVYWDYFQYEDALRTIKTIRGKFGDDTLYAFETGAILEAENKETEAVSEYVKALDARRDQRQKEKAIGRLSHLSTREKHAGDENKLAKNNLESVISSAFSRELLRRKDSSFLSLGYAEFLARSRQTDKAESVLNRAIRQSANKEFLEAAKDFYRTENNNEGEQTALERLAETVKSPRQSIAYRLQLADSFGENQKPDRAKTVIDALVQQFPTNYGVLTETSDFYNRLGFENQSAQVLENALPTSRGSYRNALTQKLAARLIGLNRLDSAERILANLHDEDKANIEIFDELARVYVRAGKPNEMRKAFAETVTELKNSDADRREIETQIADLRKEMIDAFTKLKDYKSAVEQHIEIINREPENEELTENAISYVERYGGAETLVNYYEKTSAEAFKNYRWNVVLARIYEANKDFENTLKNYRAAIGNQPEMPELYLAVADIETKGGNYDEALKNIDEVLAITGDQIEYVKKKIEILKKAGRFSEIEVEKAKLPAEVEKKIAVDQFAEARKLQNTEQEKAREIYRAAFGKLLENPLSDQLRAADISGYVQSIREDEPLDEINKELWNLRKKLIEIADKDNSTGAGEARSRLTILEGALTESIGATARNIGTDKELEKLHEDLRHKIEETSLSSDRHASVSLIQNLSRRAGFGDLEEMILRKKVEADNSTLDGQMQLRNLVNFYNERGAYQKTFDALEKYGSDDLQLRAEAAKLVENREKELEALRLIYWKPSEKIRLSDDENVARYLDILYGEKPDELKSLTEKSSANQLQLINFLLRKGARQLAHAAIEKSNFPAAWKVSRNAETSLALREFGEESECFFCEALQFDSIGEMVKQIPDKQRFLINDDWFRLAREYGEWHFDKKDKEIPPRKFLVAMIENQPRNRDEQFKLGEFYFERNELKSAIEHLRLAVETDNSFESDEKTKWVTLGAAYFKIGRPDYAEESWARVLEDESVQSGAIYFQVFQKYGLSRQGREKLSPIIVKFLRANDAKNSEDFQKLIRSIVASFNSEQEKSAYFQAILHARPTDTSLAAMLINENLIGKDEQKSFYQLLINRKHDTSDYDYNFTSVVQRVWTAGDAESVYDQENEYKTEEPENDKYNWQKKYLELLINRRENVAAGQTIAEIEKELSGRYARPVWLREAKIKLEIRAGKFDEPEIKRFVGINISDSAAEIKPPSVERFNDILQILKDENRPADQIRLSESFFARMLALEQFNTGNFAGLARAFFKKDEPEKALQILRLMTEISDETKKEAALAEIAGFDSVKIQAADPAKISETESNSINTFDALKIAAEIATEFKQTDAAIAFRRQLAEAKPSDSANKIELAKILITRAENEDAQNLLTEIINDKNSSRPERWQARLVLNAEIPNIGFDSFSQFYTGMSAENLNQFEAATDFYINSLIADNEAEISARQNLIKLYALTDKPFAVLRLAETDKTAKSDELLDVLSVAAEKTGDFDRAIEFENAKPMANAERISVLQKLKSEKNAPATDFKVDSENTRKL
ncbi:MAG: tetratricopeptide repeat protein [Acidobacteriota bacterium]|nr:tetratricopeptide repeat protein [Acidobacteriota bacterium]